MHKRKFKKYFQGSRKLPQAHEKVNKNDIHVKMFLIEGGHLYYL